MWRGGPPPGTKGAAVGLNCMWPAEKAGGPSLEVGEKGEENRDDWWWRLEALGEKGGGENGFLRR